MGLGGTGTGRVQGRGNFGTCCSCTCGLGTLDAAVGDSLCALCRADLPKLKCIECSRRARSTRERWIIYRGYLFCPECSETIE